jgi:uncharacterized repeat protein (TIGR01451 family)
MKPGVIRTLLTWYAPVLGDLLAVTALTIAILASPVSSVTGVSWRVVSVSNTTVQPGGQLTYHIDVTNGGSSSTDGSQVNLTVRLPEGMTGVSAQIPDDWLPFDCPGIAGATVITCSGTPTFVIDNKKTLTITVELDSGTSADVLTTAFDVDGGGAVEGAHTVDPVRVSSTAPGFGIDAFDAAATKGGLPLTQAGGHPDELTTSIDFNMRTHPDPAVGDASPVEDARDVAVELPPGLVGNPTGLGECTQSELTNGGADPQPLCPASSQVGLVLTRINAGAIGPLPVYNMVPPPGSPAQFGFNVYGTIVVLNAHVRSDGDYGLGVTASNIPQGLAITGNTVTLWGVPSDSSHDEERACPGQPDPTNLGPTCTSGAARKAFFRNPTSCTAPGTGLTTTLRIDSWEHPGDFKSATISPHEPPGYPFAPVDWGQPLGIDGCENVPFTPVLTAQPIEGSKAGAPSGFAFDLTVPQDDRPETPASQSDVRKVTVTLPEGARVNPSSADGLGACTSEQIALRSTAEPTCPDNSKLGTVTIDTPLLDVPVTGNIFLAKPFDNPFNALVAVYVVASAKGVVIKLPGLAVMDPDTGQISTTFDDNPQLPFSRLHVEFRGGARAPLVTPKACGTYTTHAELTGWNGRAVSSDSSFTLTENARGEPCPSTFTPGFSAGTESNSAGSSSSFLMRFTRDDEDQELKGLTVHLPRGLTGKIASADLCSDAQAGSDSCPAGSKIGDVTVGAGAGSNPFFIQSGKAYLTGPYKGAPFGVAIVVPAVAGPFDLGKVTVRSALFVDKHDATVRIVSDPFPTILKGIPLDVRDVRVNVNKPGFFLNPTSCAEKAITGTLTSTEGATAHVSDRFQAADCASLGFRPHMTMRVGGRGHTRRGQTSAFTTRLTMPQRNQANLRFVRVTLPKTINARLNTINDACTRAEFESDISRCAHAQAGSAVAVTPLLRDPLRGTVYFVKNGHPIPDLFVALRGQVDFDLIGRITIPGGTRLRTTFATAPDVPIRSFTLRLLGGSRTASIGAAANLCSSKSRRQLAQVDYIGQNGKVRQVDQKLKVGGCARRSHRGDQGRR